MTQQGEAGEADKAVAEVLTTLKRLMTVTIYTARSFGLYLGANEVLLATAGRDDPDVREVILEYCVDARLITVMRLCLLLDQRAKVSFEAVHQHLKNSDVAEGLVQHTLRQSRVLEGQERYARAALVRFNEEYLKIDRNALHWLRHLRNTAVAHLDPKKPPQSSEYDDLEKLTRTVARMSDELTVFVLDDFNAQAEDDIAEFRCRAVKAWGVVQSATTDPTANCES